METHFRFQQTVPHYIPNLVADTLRFRLYKSQQISRQGPGT